MKIVHVDMDAFFASVEELDNPKLKHKPVIVGGGPTQRGVVSAANYVARQFGVTSAMPTANALRLCPNAVLIKPRHKRYIEISKKIQEIFNRYTPLVQPLSLDEAFLDLNSSVKLFGPVIDIAKRIKTEISDELNLIASVGIAPNKFLAKLASDAEKPNGFVIIQESQISAFLEPLPVQRLWGVGKSTTKRLEQHGIYTVLDLKNKRIDQLKLILGDVTAQHLWNLARGIDNRCVSTQTQTKSISREITFTTDMSNLSQLNQHFLLLTEDVCQKMRNESLTAKTVQIKYRQPNYKTFTRSKSQTITSNQTKSIWATVCSLVSEHINSQTLPIRLIGVGLSNFESASDAQTDLFYHQNNSLDLLSDTINQKFGQSTLSRAKGIIKNNKLRS